MAPRKAAPAAPALKKRVASNGVTLPEPIKPGEVFTDNFQQKWKIGKSVGVGGFGEIYLASNDINSEVGDDARYAVKVEPHANGPLFVEINFYLRVAKPEQISQWVAENNLQRLGMPYYIASGSHCYKKNKYRFLVMERFGKDLWKIFEECGRKFNLKTVLTLGIQIINILEYIHSREFIHVDIKGSNLLLGYEKDTENQVYLVDYGLACRYASSDGVHKDGKPDARKAHDGTIEYTSRDAHIGAHSRRGDLEILGYNMVQWLSGSLPWMDNLSDCDYVHLQKQGFMSNIPAFMRQCFRDGNAPDVIEKYLKYVASLNFNTNPDYEYCRKLFEKGLKQAGLKNDGKLSFTGSISVPKGRKLKRNVDEVENVGGPKPAKIPRNRSRPGATLRPPNRITRNTPVYPVLRSQQLETDRLFASDPEKAFRRGREDKEKQKQKSEKKHLVPVSKPVLSRTSSFHPDTSLNNPTPAMLEMMGKMNNVMKTSASSGKKIKTISLPSSPRAILTPAMEEVLKRRQEREKAEHSIDNASQPSRKRPKTRGCKNVTVPVSTAVKISSPIQKQRLGRLKKSPAKKTKRLRHTRLEESSSTPNKTMHVRHSFRKTTPSKKRCFCDSCGF